MIRQMGRLLTAGLFATVFAACELTVPDFNNPSVEDLQNNPNTAAVAGAAPGRPIYNPRTPRPKQIS
ncbi:MAG: hypothetical protein F4Y07_00030 [Gemmatimonadetes bacterium]|nr:hypothetical protein [Gemmatimonadota bacterium]